MSAAFELQLVKATFACDRERDFFDASHLGLAEIEQFHLPIARADEPRIHVEQIANEQRRLFAAGARSDFKDARAARHRIAGGQNVFEFGLQSRELRFDLRQLGPRVIASFVV